MSSAARDAAQDATPSATIIGGTTVYDDYEHHLQSIPASSYPAPFLLKQFVESHVSSGASTQYVYPPDCQFHLQMRSGQFVHQEYHVQGGEEWYYVMQGEALLKLIDGRSVQEFPLPVGSCFLVPGGTPKSLQLCDGCTILVVTRQRKTDESYAHGNKQRIVPHLTHLNGNEQEKNDPLDELLWLCKTCGGVAHKQQFACTEYLSQSSELVSTFDAAAARGSVQCDTCRAAYPAQDKTILASHVTNTDADAKSTSLRTIPDVQSLLSSALVSAPSHLPDLNAPFPAIDRGTHPPPYHLFSWIESNRHLLAPPVCNSLIHGLSCQWKVMIVGGPNERTDYHIDDGEEFFLMIKGDMTLKVVDDEGRMFRDIPIAEGECFLLPSHVPHSPQRRADTIGLVIERERFAHELDGLRWYCANEQCRAHLKTFSFRCVDLGSQLKPLIQYWYEDSPAGIARRTCPKCGQIETKPGTLAQIKQYSH